jgi:hypothetical protein
LLYSAASGVTPRIWKLGNGVLMTFNTLSIGLHTSATKPSPAKNRLGHSTCSRDHSILPPRGAAIPSPLLQLAILSTRAWTMFVERRRSNGIASNYRLMVKVRRWKLWLECGARFITAGKGYLDSTWLASQSRGKRASAFTTGPPKALAVISHHHVQFSSQRYH